MLWTWPLFLCIESTVSGFGMEFSYVWLHGRLSVCISSPFYWKHIKWIDRNLILCTCESASIFLLDFRRQFRAWKWGNFVNFHCDDDDNSCPIENWYRHYAYMCHSRNCKFKSGYFGIRVKLCLLVSPIICHSEFEPRDKRRAKHKIWEFFERLWKFHEKWKRVKSLLGEAICIIKFLHPRYLSICFGILIFFGAKFSLVFLVSVSRLSRSESDNFNEIIRHLKCVKA